MSWALRDVYPRPATMAGMKRARLEKGTEMRKYSFKVNFQRLRHVSNVVIEADCTI